MSELDLTEAIEAAAQGLTDYRQGKGCSPDIQSKTYAEAAVRAAAPIIERAVGGKAYGDGYRVGYAAGLQDGGA